MAERGRAGRVLGAHIVVAVGFAVIAALFAGLLILADLPQGALDDPAALWSAHGSTLMAHAAGGALAGVVLAVLFGRRGILGWLLALFGGALATLVGGALGGLMSTVPLDAVAQTGLTDIVDLAAGALVVPMTLAASPFLWLLWFALVAAVHAAVGGVRHG